MQDSKDTRNELLNTDTIFNSLLVYLACNPTGQLSCLRFKLKGVRYIMKETLEKRIKQLTGMHPERSPMLRARIKELRWILRNTVNK